MRILLKSSLCLILVMCLVVVGHAQSRTDCDQLRAKVTQLESLDINTMSPSILQLYKQALLKIYSEFSACLDRDIQATIAMQRSVEGTSAAGVVAEKLEALKKEKANAEAKLTVIREAANGDIVTQPVQPRSTANNNGGAVTDADANRTADPRPTTPTATRATSPPRPNPQAAECLPGVPYADAPLLLTDLVERATADAVEKNKASEAVKSISKMVLYTIFDSASAKSSQMVRELEAYHYLGETARTDKQLGSSANSNGAVSAIEKPGFAQLLGFAVEHGGITKKNDGTNLTLSTSLYSLYAMSGGDTAATYDRAGFLNRFAGSATFALDDQTDELANARRNNLTQWSAKARLFGDRSTRSASYRQFWNEKVRPVIRKRLVAIGTSIEGLSDRIEGYDTFESDLDGCLVALVDQTMKSDAYKAASVDARKQMLRDLVLSRLKANVAGALATGGRLKVTPEIILSIERQYIPAIKTAFDDVLTVDKELRDEIEKLQKGPLGTFAYTNYRIPTGSDYSEAKFLFEQDKSFLRPLKLTGNVGVSFYNKPDPALNQKRVRDFTAALSFEGTSNSPFTETENRSKITYSFVGRYERLFENRRTPQRRPDIGTFQFVMEIPFFMGLSLPLSATYANATEEENKKHFRFNFGMRLDTDKLFELLKAGANR